jgi:hypothetical protein
MLRIIRLTVRSVLLSLFFLGLAIPCYAIPDDRFVFGFSGGLVQTLTLDGSRSLSAIHQGWYNELGFHAPSNPNYIAGICCGSDHHNFFVFALPPRSSPIASATLNLFEPIGISIDPGFGYSSPNPTETYRLFDVSTSTSDLVNGVVSPAIFADLGSGVSFGSVVTSLNDNGTTIPIPLNSAGIAALNLARGGEFALGGAVDLNPVPEPATLLLVGTSVAGVGLARWWKRRRAGNHEHAA